MGAAFSSNPFSSSKDAPAESAQTPSKKKRKYTKQKKSDVDIVRRSRRITKSNPRRVIFPTIPKSKTPRTKKYPLTPKSRKKVEEKSKPILLRKSPRNAKHKIPTTTKGVLKYTPNATYEVDEPIFVWEKGVIYEARVLKRDNLKYCVHYLGYKKTNDKWITSTAMMKVDPKSRKCFREMRGKLSEF